MPKLLRVRAPQDKAEEQKVRKLANSRHALGGYLRLLEAVAQANPTGDLYLITDNLSSHKSPPIREWLKNHPRVEQVFIPVGARWLKACRRGGGEYFDEKPWQDRALLMVERSGQPRG